MTLVRQGEADPIIDLMTEHALSSMLPRGTKTWQCGDYETTIDLVLASKELADTVLRCAAHDTEHGSDHRMIETVFDSSVPVAQQGERLLLKNAPWRAINDRIARTLNGTPPEGTTQQRTDRLMAAVLEACDLIVVRLLGSPKDLCSGFERFRAAGKPMVVVGGEQLPDAALMEQSTVPIGIAADAHIYLAQGGPQNLAQLHAFLSDTVLLTGEGFAPPVELPSWGILERDPVRTGGPTVAVLYYRAQQLAGNTAYVEALCTAVEDAGGQALAVFCASLRQAEPALLQTLRAADAMVVTVLAAGGTKPASASAGGDDEAWDVAELAALDVPILQGLCLTSSRAEWEASDDGVSPLDSATQIATGADAFVHAYSGHGVVESRLTAPWAARVVARFSLGD